MEDEAPSSQSQSDGPLEMSIDGDVEEALPQVEVSHPPDEVFPIEKILASKRINGEVHYQIKWLGYSDTENTWEPATEIDQHLIDRFEEKRKLTNKRKYSNGRAKPDSREHSQEEPDDETQQDGQSTSQPSSSLKQKKKRNRKVKEVQEEPDDETQQDGQSTSQPSSSLKQKKKRNRIVKEVQKEPDDESQLGGQSTPMPSYSFKRKKKRNRIVKGFIKQPVIRLHRPITAMALASRNPFATGCNVRPPITAMASDDGIGGGDLGGEESHPPITAMASDDGRGGGDGGGEKVRPLIPAMASDDESGGGDGGGQESHPPITAMASDDGRGGGDGGGEKINQIHPSITAMASDDGRGGGDGGGEKSHPPITAMASDDGRGGGDRGGEEINQIHPSITAMASDDGRGGGDGGGQESHPPITAMASDDGPVDGDGGGEETNQSQPPITAMASDDGRGGGDGGGEKVINSQSACLEVTSPRQSVPLTIRNKRAPECHGTVSAMGAIASLPSCSDLDHYVRVGTGFPATAPATAGCDRVRSFLVDLSELTGASYSALEGFLFQFSTLELHIGPGDPLAFNPEFAFLMPPAREDFDLFCRMENDEDVIMNDATMSAISRVNAWFTLVSDSTGFARDKIISFVLNDTGVFEELDN